MAHERSRRPIIAGLALTLSALLVFLGAPQSRSDDTGSASRPAKKDSPAFLKPKEVSVSTAVKPASVKPGDTVVYSVTVKLEPEWHIYTYATTNPADDQRSTHFDFFDKAGLKPVSDWASTEPPIKKEEPALNNEVLEFYENEVTWNIKLQVPEDARPGKKTLKCQLGFQICNPRSCKNPTRWTLPEAELTVLSAGAGQNASSAPPAPPAAEKAAAPLPAKTETAPAVALTKPEPAAPSRSVAEAPAETAASKPVVNEIAQKAQQGIVPFLIASALGGLLALLMPCVWPMVPITVNFFVKQGQSKQGGNTTRLAITYCLAIISVFTAVGVLCSFFFSASSLQRLANNPWLNAAIAILFLAFGMSLLGLFEFRLPSFLLNASARGESRGGLVGVFFMALTLTITSFTCTFPVVGGLIVIAAKGEFFYPIIGLATFATVLALPFFLLALAPGLLSKMPKSGDWLNAVKVVGGLVEVGAAFKFINAAEIGFGAIPSETFFDAQVVLTSWVILVAVSGLYLLGLFRTNHDHDEIKVGPGRILIGSLFLMLALFLAPALFGRPPQSQLWYQLVGILPPDVAELNAAPGPAALALGQEKVASSTVPEEAEREQKNFHGVLWGMSYSQAVEQAKAKGRPILIDFTGVNCPNCRKMEQYVLPRPEVVRLLDRFVTVQLFTDFVPLKPITQEQREELAAKNAQRLIELTNDNSNPSYVVLSPDGRVLARLGGAVEPAVFIEFLNKGLSNHQEGNKVARNDSAG